MNNVSRRTTVMTEPSSIENPSTTGRGLLFLASIALPLLLSGCFTPTPLLEAIRRDDVRAVRNFLDKGANPREISGHWGQEPLCDAASNGQIEVMKALLEKGVSIDPVTCRCIGLGMGRACYLFPLTPLGLSALTGHVNAVRFLVDRGADLNGNIATMEGELAQYPRLGSGRGVAAINLLKQVAKERELARTAPTVNALAERAVPEDHAAIKSDADQPKYSRAEYPENFAVVIGVEQYAGLPLVRFAVHDAKAMRDHLVALGYPARNIMFMTDQQATRAGLVKTIDAWLPNRVSENSTVFFYYSGHGAPDPKSNMAYLVPVDGDPEYLEQTAYPLKTLYHKLDALKAKRVIVALDSCFSGAGGRSVLAKDARPLVNKIELGANATGKVVTLSASKSDQISGTVEDEGHGAFTYYLLKGLNGSAQDDDGHVTLKSLYDYLSPKVADAARLHNHDQEPQIIPASGEAIDARLR